MPRIPVTWPPSMVSFKPQMASQRLQTPMVSVAELIDTSASKHASTNLVVEQPAKAAYDETAGAGASSCGRCAPCSAGAGASWWGQGLVVEQPLHAAYDEATWAGASSCGRCAPCSATGRGLRGGARAWLSSSRCRAAYDETTWAGASSCGRCAPCSATSRGFVVRALCALLSHRQSPGKKRQKGVKQR